MKFEYEKPALEEIELVLEGSFLDSDTGNGTPDNPAVPIDPDPDDSDEWN